MQNAHRIIRSRFTFRNMNLSAAVTNIELNIGSEIPHVQIHPLVSVDIEGFHYCNSIPILDFCWNYKTVTCPIQITSSTVIVNLAIVLNTLNKVR